MGKEERRWLVKSIREVLLPALHAQGFETVALTEEEKRGLHAVYPFGRLRRSRGTVFDVIEILMEKYGHPSFGISAGVVPLTGIDHVLGHVPAKDVWSSYLPQHYALYGIPFIGRGFSLWHWPGRKVSASDIQALVADTTRSVIPEIENALRNGKCGRHVWKFGG